MDLQSRVVKRLTYMEAHCCRDDELFSPHLNGEEKTFITYLDKRAPKQDGVALLISLFSMVLGLYNLDLPKIENSRVIPIPISWLFALMMLLVLFLAGWEFFYLRRKRKLDETISGILQYRSKGEFPY